jgi:MATE family multidrug resistance protein
MAALSLPQQAASQRRAVPQPRRVPCAASAARAAPPTALHSPLCLQPAACFTLRRLVRGARGASARRTRVSAGASPPAAQPAVPPAPPADETDFKSVLKFAAPALGIFAANPLLTLIDTAFVGASGPLAQAALNPCSVVLDFPNFVFSFLATATTNLISREADREAGATRVLRLSYTLALFAGLWLFAANVALAPAALRALGTPPATAAAAMSYISVRRLMIPFLFITSTSMSSFLALRDPMTPLRWTAVSAVVNIIGDYLLCVVWPHGVAGAAWATLASQAVMLVGLLSSLRARGLLPKLWPLPTPALLAPFASFAGPVSVLALIRVAGFTALAAHANGLGDAAALAAHQISVSVLVLLSICGEPLNATGQTRLPRLYPGGAAPDARAASALVATLVRAALAVGAASCAIGAAALLGGGRFMAADAGVYGQLVRIVPPYCACLALTATTMVLDGMLVARKDFSFLVPTQAAALAVLIVSLNALKRFAPELGLPAIWAAYFIYLVWRAVLYSFRLSSYARKDSAAAAALAA